MIKYRETDFSPNIFCINTLLDASVPEILKKRTVNIIAANPPWGLNFSRTEKKLLAEKYPEITSGESFSYFLKACIDLLKKDSSLIFILPESILNIKTHKDIREYIFRNTSIKGIRLLRQKFRNVFTGVIILELHCGKKIKTVINRDSRTFKIDTARFKDNEDHIFDINISDEDHKIIRRMLKKPHFTLKNNADWALGIVTGDNSRFLMKDKTAGEPVFRGRDVNPYLLSEPEHFIKFMPQYFQQTAPAALYRAEEKLIYRFISKRLVFAYDKNRHLTLNSANIVIPRLKNYPLKLVLALFNSTLYQFIFQKKYGTIKVLRSHLESLPLPVLAPGDINLILSRINNILEQKEIVRYMKIIDNIIFSLFEFTEAEQNYITKSIE